MVVQNFRNFLCLWLLKYKVRQGLVLKEIMDMYYFFFFVYLDGGISKNRDRKGKMDVINLVEK